ncbi:MAG: hypothetical protein ACLRX7_10195 [Acutalibacteraceae bacterium]
MPRIFLSPSLQPYNEYYGSGNEQEYMNKLADAMIPYLRTNGIQYTRNKIGTNVGQSIRDSNAGYYDLHLLFIPTQRRSPWPENCREQMCIIMPTARLAEMQLRLSPTTLKRFTPIPIW